MGGELAESFWLRIGRRAGTGDFESSPEEKDLRVLVDEKAEHDPATQAGSPETQPHPGLHQKKRGQQVKGGDCPSLLFSGGSPPGALCPALGSLT